MEKDYLDLVEEQIIKEEDEHIACLDNLKKLRKMSENIYKNGFKDCLRFLGVIGENNCFDFNNEVFNTIYREIGIDGLKEMISKYSID